ncbi:hypothetical protein GC207_13995 [bacterium]|nr:hypothetical protein [bacterium]
MAHSGFKRFRWWYIPLILVPIAVGVFLHWLNKPLQPPVVSLSFVGFKSTSTNTYALMCLSNLGPTRVYDTSRDWRAEIQTEKGLVTNVAPNYGNTVTPYGIKRGASVTFQIEIPRETQKYRFQTYFLWYPKHNAQLRITEVLSDHIGEGHVSRALESFLGPILGRLPDSESVYDSVATGWLTNLPTSRVAK